MITLRPYQREALDAVYEYWHEGGGHPIVSVPTGGGKSLIIAQLIREALEWWPETRILCVTHVKELIAQNFSELLSLWPEAPAGIHSAGLNRRDVLSPVIFGGIQSLYKRSRDLPRIDIVIVDEAHLIPRNSETMYRSFLAKLLELNPYLKVLGLTATPFRLDSGMLHEGDDALFSDLVYEANVHDLIDQGYLVRPVSHAGAAQVDTDSVGTRGGEFIPGQLEAAALDPGTISAICDEINASGMGRTGWLVFSCGIRHALLLRDELRARGVFCEAAFGDTPPDERKRIIEDFKARHTRCLVTVGILTTGFNARHVDLLACVRPTKSVGLWCQMIGRGLRLCPETGKEDCLVLDFGGNLARHGPIDNPIVRTPGAKDEDAKAPEKNCPECGAPNPIGARWCSECAAVFPTSERMVETKASKLSVLSNSAPEWLRVEEVHYYRHRKQGKPDSLRVQYRSGLNVYSEWICLEHGGFPRERAVQWWRRRAPEIPVPNSIDEALENTKHLEAPLEIAVRRAGKYFEIVGARL